MLLTVKQTNVDKRILQDWLIETEDVYFSFKLTLKRYVFVESIFFE